MFGYHVENNKVFKIVFVSFFFFSCIFIITKSRTRSNYDYCYNNQDYFFLKVKP